MYQPEDFDFDDISVGMNDLPSDGNDMADDLTGEQTSAAQDLQPSGHTVAHSEHDTGMLGVDGSVQETDFLQDLETMPDAPDVPDVSNVTDVPNVSNVSNGTIGSNVSNVSNDSNVANVPGLQTGTDASGPENHPEHRMYSGKSASVPSTDTLQSTGNENEKHNNASGEADPGTQETQGTQGTQGTQPNQTNSESYQEGAELHSPHTGANARRQPQRIPQKHTIVIPSYASWFCMTKISDVEQESLPEFFSNKNRSKTPQVYVKYRNFMVNAYRLNPNEYLTVTACRRNLVGDASTIMRVHHFLDEWGLINYQVDIESRPMSVAPPFTGHWKVKYDTPRGLFPFRIYEGASDPSLAPIKPGEGYSNTARSTGPNGSNGSNGPNGPSGAETAPHSTDPNSKTNDTNETSDKPSLDTPAPEIDSDGWTKEDVRSMLEAIEKYPYDWDAVADVLGKDKVAVVRKFVQQTTEDNLAEENVGPLRFNSNHIPFSKSENPVLSVLAFLTSTLDPELLEAALGRTRKVVYDRIERAKKEESSKSASTEKKDDSEKNGGSGSTKEEENLSSEKNNSEMDLDLGLDLNLDGEKPDSKEKANDKEHTGDADATKSPKESKNDGSAKDAGADGELPEGAAEAAALALGATRSFAFMSNTEKYMYEKFISLLDVEMRTIKLRLAKFNMMEKTLDTERREMDKEREFLFLDRLNYRRNVEEALALVDKAAKAATEGNASELESIATVLRERAEPEPPLRPVFKPSSPKPQEENDEYSDMVPPSAQPGRLHKLWTLEPRMK